jgi:hypothetical protein
MSQPVTLYSPDGRRSREIAAIDAPGWIGAGWSTSPVALLAEATKTTPLAPIEAQEPAAPTVETVSKAKKNDVPRNAVSEN